MLGTAQSWVGSRVRRRTTIWIRDASVCARVRDGLGRVADRPVPVAEYGKSRPAGQRS